MHSWASRLDSRTGGPLTFRNFSILANSMREQRRRRSHSKAQLPAHSPEADRISLHGWSAATGGTGGSHCRHLPFLTVRRQAGMVALLPRQHRRQRDVAAANAFTLQTLARMRGDAPATEAGASSKHLRPAHFWGLTSAPAGLPHTLTCSLLSNMVQHGGGRTTNYNSGGCGMRGAGRGTSRRKGKLEGRSWQITCLARLSTTHYTMRNHRHEPGQGWDALVWLDRTGRSRLLKPLGAYMVAVSPALLAGQISGHDIEWPLPHTNSTPSFCACWPRAGRGAAKPCHGCPSFMPPHKTLVPPCCLLGACWTGFSALLPTPPRGQADGSCLLAGDLGRDRLFSFLLTLPSLYLSR